ncbi:MAG: hypothetical protein CR972_00605 [Candidatus Moraniibacteriota bacterium]|nr:MAG: hypothetical protein CR972_00605 [Candidatus Moranbacteria bacterium]
MLTYSRKDEECVLTSEKVAKVVNFLRERLLKILFKSIGLVLFLLVIAVMNKPLGFLFLFCIFGGCFICILIVACSFFVGLAATELKDGYVIQFNDSGKIINHGFCIPKIANMRRVRFDSTTDLYKWLEGNNVLITQDFWNGENGLRKTFKLVPKDDFCIEELLSVVVKILRHEKTDKSMHDFYKTKAWTEECLVAAVKMLRHEENVFNVNKVLHDFYKTKVWDEREMHAHTFNENGTSRIQWTEDNPLFAGGIERIEMVQ